MNNELQHHGMKWGVRRYQNKDGSLTDAGEARYGKNKGEITKTGKQSSNEEYSIFTKKHEELTKTYQIEQRENEAYRYGEKHNLDLDDGGGGSRQAGIKYDQMWDNIQVLRDRAINEASDYVDAYMRSEYGQVGINKLKSYHIRKGTATAGAAMAIPLSLMAVVFATR